MEQHAHPFCNSNIPSAAAAAEDIAVVGFVTVDDDDDPVFESVLKLPLVLLLRCCRRSLLSILIDATSFTMTAMRKPSRLDNIFCNNVVLPHPKKPDNIVMGIGVFTSRWGIIFRCLVVNMGGGGSGIPLFIVLSLLFDMEVVMVDGVVANAEQNRNGD